MTYEVEYRTSPMHPETLYEDVEADFYTVGPDFVQFWGPGPADPVPPTIGTTPSVVFTVHSHLVAVIRIADDE